MPEVIAYATKGPKELLAPFSIPRRDPGPLDVVITIQYCGVCHSDIHQARDEWGGSIFPMVPGHEITGVIKKVGIAVKKFKVGDRVGVGCFIDSCGSCSACQEYLEQYCQQGPNLTYNGHEKDGSPTYGGYAKEIVVNEKFVLSIPAALSLDKAAPLLCAGITTYSPLNYFNVKKGDKVGVMGLGGLGHMAVKIAQALGAEVTVLSHSAQKADDAKKLGATHFANTKLQETFKEYDRYFNLIINTVSANIDLQAYLHLLTLNGVMVLLGVPEKPAELPAFSLIGNRRSIAGSLVGGIKETQDCLDFCAKHHISADIELIAMADINKAYERMVKGDVHYRFVIDMKTF